jgi:cellulose synthase/poly-beta-1,6-N-acetylglucosamine synthase-like glycosyltransferase
MSKFGLCWSFPAIESEVYYQRKLFDPWRKGMAVNRSLTVLLPVRDAQSTLAATVTQVLEMASDLSERFELLIIDDGSSDATSEMALEFSRRYPQIRMIHHSQPLGEEAALRTGLAQSRGDVVFVRGGQRLTFERISWASQPVRPNYLGRARTFAREGL